MSGTRKWYVVHTHPNAELIAAEHLHRQGFEVYVPRFRKLRRHARKNETVVRALFPRYFFVAFDIAAERWQAVRSTIGIARLVGGSNGPTPVGDDVLTDLQRREDASGFVRLDSRSRFSRGEKIKLVGSGLSTCLGRFEGMADNERIAVLLDMLGRQVRVIVDGEIVAHA